MLAFVGCIALPGELFERAYGGQELPADEKLLFCAHPEAGARHLSNIPRLEVVAEIIRLQQTPDASESMAEDVRFGAHLLHLALALDQKIYRFRQEMLEALSSYSPVAIPVQDSSVKEVTVVVR
jgi:hypothetical protein